jgi:hypothetical protein
VFSLFAGVGSFVWALPVFAIERPLEADVVPAHQKGDVQHLTRPVEGKQKKRAMIGVGGAPASKTLSLHLGLAEGVGLTLFYIVPDSPAAKAGLLPHDVMTSFGGKPIGCQLDLRTAIAAYHPGDEVEVGYIHQGKPMKKKVLLAVRSPQMGNGLAPDAVPGVHPRWMLQGMGGQIPEADRKRLEEHMKQHLQQLRFQLNQRAGQGQQMNHFQLDIPDPKGDDLGFQMDTSTSITMSDEDGSVTMKSVNGKKEVVVRDRDQKVLFEGPYDTPQDKAAVPDYIRKRLHKLNLDDGGDRLLHLRIRPESMKAPQDSKEDENAQ